jgi:hypothetical protein
LFLLGCQSTDKTVVKQKTTLSLELQELGGIKKYKAGKYKEAFDLLKTPATWGYKGSQYAIAFMFLKGQYVNQSTLLGMGWLGVATEAKTSEWFEQYQAFYNAASDDEKLKIDKIVAEYIRRYGMKAQHITCRRYKDKGVLSFKQKCYKSDRLSVVYGIDMVE